MGEHSKGRHTYRRGSEAAARRVIALLNGEPVFEPPPQPQWHARPGIIKLHVSNLNYDVTEADVRELFARCGDIAECHLENKVVGWSRMRSEAYTACPVCGRRYPVDQRDCVTCRFTQSHVGSRVELWDVRPGAHGLVWTPPRWFGRNHGKT